MFHNLSDWLAHLEAVSAQRELQPLSRVRTQRFETLSSVAKSLDILEIASPIITVAGTNGKGSCVGLLSSIYCAAGYRVGSFTSPHLLRYNERIQINQQPVSDEQLCDAFNKIEKAREDAPLGYFEVTTLAGLLLFKEAKLDVLVLEVGLGGRLDPVNLIDSDVALISSIALDHTHILGHTIEAIAFEKAGIMRSKTPCIWGDADVPQNIIDYANELGAPLSVYKKDFKIEHVNVQNKSDATWSWSNTHRHLEALPFPNITYLPNAACALQAVDLLQPRLPVTQDALCKGLCQVMVPGRFQIIEGKVKTILDVAHNPASAKLLADNLASHPIKGRVLMVMAILSTKDIEGILSPLVDTVDHWYFGEFKLQKCAEASTLVQSLASPSKGNCSALKSVEEAYEAAVRDAQPNDVIVVAGSFHTVAAVMALI